jgi:hypothetical protein
VLVASAEGAADPRLPRARPATESELAVASVAPPVPPVPAPLAPAATDPAALAFAPPPRSRPDSVLLSGTLEVATAAPAGLAVAPEDAIAALTQRSQATLPVKGAGSAAPLRVAVAPPAPAAPATKATAIAAATALATEAAGAPRTARPRPVALAFAGSGLPTATDPMPAPAKPTRVALATSEPAAPAPPEAAPVPAATPTTAAKGDRMSIAAMAAEGLAATYDNDQGDLRELIVQEPAPRPAAADGFTMPEPTGADGFFSAPATASGVTEIAKQPSPPVNGFKAKATEARPAENEGEGSFFSKLFASLTK